MQVPKVSSSQPLAGYVLVMHKTYGFSPSAIGLIKLFADSRYLTHHVQLGIRMTTLCLADLDLIPCDQKPKGNTPTQLELIEMLKAKPTEQGASTDSISDLRLSC